MTKLCQQEFALKAIGKLEAKVGVLEPFMVDMREVVDSLRGVPNYIEKGLPLWHIFTTGQFLRSIFEIKDDKNQEIGGVGG